MSHVFIINGDITKLACDAWLLPSDRTHFVTEPFAASAGLLGAGAIDLDRRREWPTSGCYLLRESTRWREPDIWVGDVGRTERADVRHFAERAEGFIASAAERAHARAATQGQRPLLAVNVLGSGEGGKRSERLALLKVLLASLSNAAGDHDCDVALVTYGQVMYAAAQKVRRGLESSHPQLWSQLPPELAGVADDLAGSAKMGQLVTFLGAGVGVDAGVPLWRPLLLDIASEINALPLPAGFEKLDPRDQASILRKGRSVEFDAAVQRVLVHEHYSLVHGLLASLPVHESVTTNFDNLYEAAANTPGRSLAVIPGQDASSASRWLLKLHGTLGKNLVLTRGDYLGASSSHAALRGLVQAMLLTRKMLFVGYSLSDEDFHQLVHEVRLALGESASASFGTVLALFPQPSLELLWDELKIVAMSHHHPSIPEGDSTGAGRRLAIFLDRLGSRAASDVAFIASDGMGELDADDERRLAEIVTELQAMAAGRPESQWAEVRDFLVNFEEK